MAQIITQTEKAQTQSLRTYSIWLTSIVTLIATILVNLFVLWLAVSVFGVSDGFIGLQAISLATVTTMWSVPAIIVFALLRRFTKNYNRNYIIISIVALLLSYIPNIATFTTPEAYPGITFASAIVLVIFHLTSAIVIVSLLTTFTRPFVRKPKA